MSEIIHGFRYEMDSDGIVTITMDMDGQVNAMNDQYRQAMAEILTKLEAEVDLTGVILASAKKTFFAGGDLRALVNVPKGEEASQFHDVEDYIKAPLRRLEKMPVPVVAVINGAAMGGGLEICLAANHRIAWNSPSVLVALPEVTLGLLPGGGGVIRTIHMLGLKKALPLLLEGTALSSEKAFDIGWVDQLVESINQLIPAAKNWIKENPESCIKPWDVKGYKIPGGNVWSQEITNLLTFAPAQIFQKTCGLLPAPDRILAVAGDAMVVDFDTACRIESRGFAKLVTTREAKNIITSNFFQIANVKKGASRPPSVKLTTINSVALLGSGPDVEVISGLSNSAGIEVTLVDNVDVAQNVDLIIEVVPKGSVATVQHENTIAIHVVAPVDKTPLLELICQQKTSDETLAKAFDYARKIRKTAIVVNNIPGLFTARVTDSYIDEGARLLSEGLSPVLIKAMNKLIGMPEGLLSNQSKATNEVEIPHQDIKDRLLVRQIIESAICLQEGVLRSVAEGNVGSLLGCAAPTWTGGFLQVMNTWEHGEKIGIGAFAARASELEAAYGDRFALPTIVTEKIQSKLLFY